MPRRKRLSPGQTYGGGGGGGGGLMKILGAVYGGDVGINPDFELAQEAQNAEFVAKGSDTERALKAKGSDRPYKANNIFAKGNADAMNSDYFQNRITMKGEVDAEKDLKKFDKELEARFLDQDLERLNKEGRVKMALELEAAEKKGIITNKQRLELEEGLSRINLVETREKSKISEEEKDNAVIRDSGMTSKMKPEYENIINPLALSAKGNRLQADTAGARAEKEGSITKEISAKRTRPYDTDTAELNARLGERTARGNNEIFSGVMDNKKFDVKNHQRNAEADFINQFLKPLSEGQNIVDVRRGNIVAKGPSMMDFMQAPQTVQNPTGEVITLQSGRKVRAATPSTAPQNPIQQQPAEKATEVVQQPAAKPAPVERGAIGNAVNALGQGLEKGYDKTSEAFLKTIPRALLLKLLSPYYKPAPAQ